MAQTSEHKLLNHPVSWTSGDRKRYEKLCKTIAFIDKVIEDNGFIVKRHILLFNGNKVVYKVLFG